MRRLSSIEVVAIATVILSVALIAYIVFFLP
jgi:hypothetical protein